MSKGRRKRQYYTGEQKVCTGNLSARGRAQHFHPNPTILSQSRQNHCRSATTVQLLTKKAIGLLINLQHSSA
jgi:hypothetical protein